MEHCSACGSQTKLVAGGICISCARRQSATSALPFLGAALAAAGLIAGGAILVERMQHEGGSSPLGDLSRRLRGATPTLETFSRDLTQLARENALDPVIGRDAEIDRVIAILARRSKNNPVLVGEPGVGKTAIAEGLAQRIATGNVPASLRNKRVLALALGALVAGTKYRGELESRVKRILDEIKRSARDVILFIDELHALVGAGAAEGALDISSMIKPELARGDLQCVGATTFDEYRKYIEADAALERRFQPVQIDEPSIEATIMILRGLRAKYAQHHHVIITDAAVEAAATLAARYIPDRFLPDKAIDALDEASASVALNAPAGVSMPTVDARDIASVITKWTGVPQEALTENESSALLHLEATLERRVVGQSRAIAAVSEAVRRARAGLHDPRKPLGTFLFRGPSGVGKTELAKTLAEALFGSETALIRIDLSEFGEAHAIARLIGAPPGYAGYDEAGQLTEAVRRRPYCVVLFDEFEKAHADVASLLLALLDEGRISDAKGRIVDFRHALVILTTNLTDDELPYAVRPELINRIDEIVAFQALPVEAIAAIVTIHLDALAARLGTRNIRLDITGTAANALAREAMSGDGAREVARVVTRYVATPISHLMLGGKLPTGATVYVAVNSSGKIPVSVSLEAA